MREESSPKLADVSAVCRTLTPWCPASGCVGQMAADVVMASLEGTGLESLRCPRCGHRGFRARDRLQILFGGRHEHSGDPVGVCDEPMLHHVIQNSRYSVRSVTVVSRGRLFVRLDGPRRSPFSECFLS